MIGASFRATTGDLQTWYTILVWQSVKQWFLNFFKAAAPFLQLKMPAAQLACTGQLSHYTKIKKLKIWYLNLRIK